MKEELMLLGFISLLLTATSSIISNICIPSKFYNIAFAPSMRRGKNKDIKETFFNSHSHRRVLNGLNQNTCRKMGMNCKAALIPQGIRETIHGWGKAARRKRRHGTFADDSTIHTDTSAILSVEEDDDQLVDRPRVVPRTGTEIELQPYIVDICGHSIVANETSSKIGTPLLRPTASISSTVSPRIQPEVITRSLTMPTRRE